MITSTDLNTLKLTAHGDNVCAKLNAMEPSMHWLAAIYRAQELGTISECRRMAWNVIKRFGADLSNPLMPALCRPDPDFDESFPADCFIDYERHCAIG